MLKYKNIKEQLEEERRKNAALQAKLIRKTSDIDYIAMMCDVELEVSDEETDNAEDMEV
ncbi:MAG: hypothetical protein PHR82_06690 [Endomicrobiaceae bacterium]|nr:hypothetical protein [Endomicrobiaceae bacterium]